MGRPAKQINVYLGEEGEAESSSGVSNLPRSEVVGHIYFYEQINQGSALRLITQLHNLDEYYKQQKAGKPWGYYPEIYLHLNSEGGDAFASFAIADRIAMLDTPVHCYIEGMVASGGTLIAFACAQASMSYNSVMLIHQPSSWFVGTYEQWKDESKLQEILISRLVEFYQSTSNMSEEEVRDMLKRDYWMDAKEALEKGFIDSILQV